MSYTSTDQPLPSGKLLKFYECGICSCYHPLAWDGDCRDDANRFDLEQLDQVHGPHGWECVPMPTWDDNPFHPESPEGRAWENGDRSSITP